MTRRPPLRGLLARPPLPAVSPKAGPVTFWAELAAALSHRPLPIGQPAAAEPKQRSAQSRRRHRADRIVGRPLLARPVLGMAATTMAVITISALAQSLVLTPEVSVPLLPAPSPFETRPSGSDTPTSSVAQRQGSAAPRPLLATLQPSGGDVRALAYGRGDLLATGTDGGLRLWASDTFTAAGTVAGTASVRAVAFNADGTLLASGGADGTVTVWRTGTRQRLVPPLPHSGPVTAVAFSGDSRLATASAAGTGTTASVQLWNARTGRNLEVLAGASVSVPALAFSPDGGLLAGADEGEVLLWDTSASPQAQPVASVPTDDGTPRSVAFSPRGRLLAVATSTGRLALWDVSDPAHATREASLAASSGSVDALAFSPDGSLLASGGADKVVRLWDTVSPSDVRLLRQPLTGHTGAVMSLAVSPDGTQLASGGLDGTVRLWSLDMNHS